MQVGHFAALRLDVSRVESKYPFLLNVMQATVERLLEERAAELGVRVTWSAEVTGIRQDDAGVDIEVRGPDGTYRLRAAYLVGCDGGRSAVRKLAGIDFPGTPATLTELLGDVELTDPPAGPIFQERRPHGYFSVLPFEPGWHRVMVNDHGHVADHDEPVTLEGLRTALISVAGTDYGMRSPRWLSRFGDAARQAARYRAGRVLLAGDAAHIHFPAGGQGLNLGVQDAVNLGWKLASVVRGHVPEQILDSYHAERHPVAARVLQNTRAQAALGRPGAQTDALREVSLIEFDEVNRYLAYMITALDVRYPMGEGHPLLGRRVPDVDITTADGDTRVVDLLHAGRPVLLDLSGGVADLADVVRDWTDRVDRIEAKCPAERWAVPMAGSVPAPAALLIRPDGYVAWAAPAGEPVDAASLRAALAVWFGPGQVPSTPQWGNRWQAPPTVRTVRAGHAG
jgi:2-polyprenyl-6-methoxyphenol hydroxylase-like FAD-dependent oxidoreductase